MVKKIILCLIYDLKQINKLSQQFVIQMPKMDDILNDIALQNHKVVFTSDLYKGYYLVRHDRRTNNLTAFYSPKTGQSYLWNDLPMGLSVSAGAFDKVTNHLF